MFENIKNKIIIVINVVFKLLIFNTNNKYVFFRSFSGQYNDNPKYISIKLHELDKKCVIIWDISKKSREKTLPSYVVPVKHNSFMYLYFKNKAKVLVDNGAGDYLIIKKNKIFLHKLLKNKKQLNISTWHGTPLKKIGVDINSNQVNKCNIFSTSDVILAGSSYVKDIFCSCFLNTIPVWLSGTPRNDILFNLDIKTKMLLKQKLSFPIDKNVILYAPTFRDDSYSSGVMQMHSIDFDCLLNLFKNIFGGEWVFVFRVHQMVLMDIDTKFIADQYKGKVIDGNQHDDMAEYLAVTDVLITDYSGSMFDFALTQKPCFLLTPDIDKYINERGLYMPLNKLPFSSSKTFDELVSNIKNFDYDNYKLQLNIFLEKMGNNEDGKASDRLSRLIIDYIKNGEINLLEDKMDNK